MILQTHRALARLSHCSSQCLDKHGLAPLALNLTRVATLRQAHLRHYGTSDTLRPALQKPALHKSYATDAVSRPKAHTGRTTSARRKKAPTVKPIPSGEDSPAAVTKPAAKETKAKAKAKPKPNSKTASKPRTKAKATKARKKPAKAKAKPAKKKKVLTPEEKEKILVKELKAKALSPPKGVADTAFSVLLAEKQKEAKTFDTSGSIAKECGRLYRSFTPEEREHYNHIANQNKVSYNATYRDWILSHSPTQILEANTARAALKKRSETNKAWLKLHDERLVTRRRGPYIQFTVQRFKSGDFAGLKATEATKLISAEWRGLSDDDKKPYYQEGDEDAARYQQEVKAVYNRDVKHPKVKA